jgi:hypothetical protein
MRSAMRTEIDFELTDISAGLVRYWNADGDIECTEPLLKVLDYIEHHGLNIEYWTSNRSWDGNPTHDVDHEYTHDALDYLKANVDSVSKLYYNDHLAPKERKEVA